jgi:hypothetical protein
MKRKGFSYIPPEDRPKQTVNVQVQLPYVPQSGPDVLSKSSSPSTQPQFCMLWEHDKGQNPHWGKCFATGTPVLTPDGLREIQDLCAGDLVITGRGPNGAQLTATIVSVHHSQAPQTLRLVVEGDSIVTTAGHPFLQSGSGWTRAGDLKPGDLVETADGTARLGSSEVQPGGTVWNLRLTGGSRFLVGTQGFVVHDLSAIEVASEDKAERLAQPDLGHDHRSGSDAEAGGKGHDGEDGGA